MVLKGLIIHRHHTETPTCPRAAMQYRSQTGDGPSSRLARRLLLFWREAQAVRTPAVQAGASLRREGRPHGEGDTDHQQQELFVLVAAWLAADEIFRARFRGDRHRTGRRVGARRNPAVVVFDPGTVPAARRRDRLGYAGDRRISQRGDAGCRAVARGSRSARALPLDLWRNPFRLHHLARLAAGQPEGALPRLQDLVARAG